MEIIVNNSMKKTELQQVIKTKTSFNLTISSFFKILLRTVKKKETI